MPTSLEKLLKKSTFLSFIIFCSIRLLSLAFPFWSVNVSNAQTIFKFWPFNKEMNDVTLSNPPTGTIVMLSLIPCRPDSSKIEDIIVR